MTKLPNQPYAQPMLGPTSGGSTSPQQVTTKDRRNDWEQIARIINGQLGFGSPTGGNDNMAGYWYAGTTPAGADTDFTVTHNLGRIPTGWLTVYIDKSGVIYAGSVAWSTIAITLKCSASSAAVKLFVI